VGEGSSAHEDGSVESHVNRQRLAVSLRRRRKRREPRLPISTAGHARQVISRPSCVVCVCFAVLLAGCGSTTDDGPISERKPTAARPTTIDKAAFVRRVEAACRQGRKRWSDPRAVARELPPSPIQTSAPAKQRRLAETLRGYRAIIQDVIDEVRRRRLREHGGGASAEKYAVALSRAATELEGDELKIRQQWNRELQAPTVRRHLRQARRLAKPVGLEDCASFPGKL
jgi:hypothetical protein